MTDTEYTKGPWRTGPPHAVRAETINKSGQKEVNWVAECLISGSAWGRETTAANARLISASPDFFEATHAVCLEPILWVRDEDFDEYGGFYALSKDKYDAMFAALSKAHPSAEGE